MSVDYAEQYETGIGDKLKQSALTTAGVNEDYEFTGGKTVAINSVLTSEMNDYQTSGANRYGEPAELDGGLDEVTLSKDRSFTFTIDKRRYEDARGALEAGVALNRQIEEVVAPEIDKYRLGVMADNAEGGGAGAVTKGTAYDALLAGSEFLSEHNAPVTGRAAFVSPEFYRLIKQDPAFVTAGNVADELKTAGFVGLIDGCAVVMVPKAYLPENVAFIVAHKSACVAPVKMSEYKAHDNPPGINGWLVEGRVCYDAFVPSHKKGCIYTHKTA